MLRKSYRNVRNSSRTKKIGQMRVNRGFSGIREAPNAPDLGTNRGGLERLVPCSVGSYELQMKLPRNSVATLLW